MTIAFTTDYVGAFAAVMALYVAIVVTYVLLGFRSLSGRIDALRDEFSQIADAKLLADARLASAALVAVARLAREAREDLGLLDEAQRTAEQVVATADKTAQILAGPEETNPPKKETP